MTHVRSPYNYDADVASFQSGLDMSSCDSRTQQHYRDEVDIRSILARMRGGAELPPALPAEAFADFSQVVDFHTAMDQIARSNQLFAQYPAEIRERFRNDPGRFLAFVDDPESNFDEGVKLGIFAAPAALPAQNGQEGSGGSGGETPDLVDAE